MEHIKQAVERAKGVHAKVPHSHQTGPTQPHSPANGRAQTSAQAPSSELTLSDARLESQQIISHDVTDPRSKSFDILRTQILQSMDLQSLQLIGVTSPTASCGKTTISVNLALSIARQSERSVLLIDMDLRKPQVAATLGLKCNRGLLSVLAGKSNLLNSIVHARAKSQKLYILPCEASTLSSSEWVASRSMSALLLEIRHTFSSWTIIVDLPPILPSDDVISILPQIDGVVFVVAAGSTKIQEIKECNKHLSSTSVVRIVLNKAVDPPPAYYPYSAGYAKPTTRGRKNTRTRPGLPPFPNHKATPLTYLTRLWDRLTHS